MGTDTTRRPPAASPRPPITDATREAAHVAATVPPAERSATVQAIRSQIQALKQERGSLALVHANRPETADLVRAGLQALADEGADRLRRVVSNTSALGYFDATPAFRLAALGPSDIGAVLVAVVGAEPVAAAMLAHLDAVPSVPDAAGRAARLAEIDRELFWLECEEEAAIEASEATDAEPIRRRVDADPRAVLGIFGGKA